MKFKQPLAMNVPKLWALTFRQCWKVVEPGMMTAKVVGLLLFQSTAHCTEGNQQCPRTVTRH